MKAARAVIAHRLPGRVRLFIPGQRGQGDYFSRLEDMFSNFDEVRRIRSNPKAGSCTLEFSGDFTNMMQHAEIAQLIDLHRDENDEDGFKKAFGPSALPPINLVSGRDINTMFMMGSAMTLVGILQTLRGEILIPSASAFWYAATAFFRSGEQR